MDGVGGRTDEASAGEERSEPLDGGGGALGCGESAPTQPPPGRAPGFRRRLSGSILAEVLSEGKRSDVSGGLKLSGFGGRPFDSLLRSPPSLWLLPCALQLAVLEELIRRQLWLLSLVATVFSASPSGFPRRLGLRDQEATKHWE